MAYNICLNGSVSYFSDCIHITMGTFIFLYFWFFLFSIKFVLPALFPNDPSLDYHNLSLVHKGDEASRSFLSLKNLNDEDKKTLREALLRYCELDTYAMVKILEKLWGVLDE